MYFVEGKCVEGHCVEGHCVEVQYVEGQYVEEQCVEGQCLEGHCVVVQWSCVISFHINIFYFLASKLHIIVELR